PGARGAVTVRGANASGVPSEISVSDLSVGEAGDGELTIEDGGLVRVFTGLDMGKFRGHGQLNVRGVSGSIFPSRLTVEASLAVGDTHAASMLIEGRAEVKSKGGEIFSPNPGIASEVSIIGN